MPLQQFVNGAVTTTSTNSQTNSDLVITPVSTTGFPANPQFTVLIRETSELLLVTATGATWTITRAYGGTSALAITAGNHIDYSLTREMLLQGFIYKLDEQIVSVDTANGVVTLTPTPPVGVTLRGFRLGISMCTGTGVSSNTYLLMRLNGDTNNTHYFSSYAYWGWNGGSGGVGVSGVGFARIGYIGLENAVSNPTNFSTYAIDMHGAYDTDRWKGWGGTFEFVEGSSLTTAAAYGGPLSGHWQQTAAITQVQLSCDAQVAANTWAGGTLKAGSRVVLYGLP